MLVLYITVQRDDIARPTLWYSYFIFDWLGELLSQYVCPFFSISISIRMLELHRYKVSTIYYGAERWCHSPYTAVQLFYFWLARRAPQSVRMSNFFDFDFDSNARTTSNAITYVSKWTNVNYVQYLRSVSRSDATTNAGYG